MIVNDFKKSAKLLRQHGREQVLKRIRALENSEYIPEDILSIVIATHCNFHSILEKYPKLKKN